jgi:hypothetical protein
MGDFDYLVFATPGIISKKKKEFNLWLDQIKKLIKTLNPIKSRIQVLFTEMEQQGIKYYHRFYR